MRLTSEHLTLNFEITADDPALKKLATEFLKGTFGHLSGIFNLPENLALPALQQAEAARSKSVFRTVNDLLAYVRRMDEERGQKSLN